MKTEQRLVAAEPYRLFFPMALFVGVVGVMLWPLFYWEMLGFYPLTAHTRLMVQGFVGGAAIGFLGTAMPKMLSAPPLKLWQVLVLASGYLASCVAHGFACQVLGDGLFAATLALLLACFGGRIMVRKSAAPPQMVLAVMGMLCGLLASLWWAIGEPSSHYQLTLFSQRLLYQVFILLPLLGVGSFFFPMVLGVKKSEVNGRRAWRAKTVESAVVGILILLSYWVEVHAKPQVMAWTRFLISFIWLAKESGIMQRGKATGVMVFGLRAGILCLLGGMVAVGLIETNRIALEHTLYIGGFGLITMMVATRVIYGHSGQRGKFQKWTKPLVACVALLLLAMATRVTADFMPEIRNSHHVYAAFCWVIVSVIWACAVMPWIHRRPTPAKVAKPVAPVKSVLDMDFRK